MSHDLTIDRPDEGRQLWGAPSRREGASEPSVATSALRKRNFSPTSPRGTEDLTLPEVGWRDFIAYCVRKCGVAKALPGRRNDRLSIARS